MKKGEEIKIRTNPNLKPGFTRAGRMTKRKFAQTDETFRKWCEENGFKPTMSRAQKYRRRLGI